MSDPNDTQANQDSGKPTAVLLGIGLFVVLNLGLLIWNPLSKVDPEGIPSAHTWVWWAAREYLDQAKAPDVVILGPSMLMHCVARQDADFLSENLDYVHHHRSEYMAHRFQEELGAKSFSCFNFALPGAMLSDDYMVVHGLLKGEQKPSVLVLGLGLRDFCDCQVTTPAATPTFKYLRRFGNIDDVVHLCMPQLWRRTDYWLGKITYLHGRKLDMQTVLSESFRKALGPWCQENFPRCRLEETDPTRNMPGNMRSEIEEGMYVVTPNIPYNFADNTREYEKRYRSTNDSMFEIQTEFLERLMVDCHKENIRVVLVNVPVTELNRKLMPPGYYDRYVSLLQSTAKKWNALFLNVAEDPSFQRTDFYDTVHMNASGGKKFIDKVVSSLAADSPTVAALDTSNDSRAIAARKQPGL